MPIAPQQCRIVARSKRQLRKPMRRTANSHSRREMKNLLQTHSMSWAAKQLPVAFLEVAEAGVLS
jgi:hypothetical protein